MEKTTVTSSIVKELSKGGLIFDVWAKKKSKFGRNLGQTLGTVFFSPLVSHWDYLFLPLSWFQLHFGTEAGVLVGGSVLQLAVKHVIIYTVHTFNSLTRKIDFFLLNKCTIKCHLMLLQIRSFVDLISPSCYKWVGVHYFQIGTWLAVMN